MKLDSKRINSKFGGNFVVTPDTYRMGTHHLLADYVASRFSGFNTVLDACSGGGFMTIAIAKYAKKVIAVDINDESLEISRQNLKIANVAAAIELIHGDILTTSTLEKVGSIDGAFIDPSWRRDIEGDKFLARISNMVPDVPLLLRAIESKSRNIILKLPVELELSEMKKMPDHQLERIYLGDEFKFYVAYFGGLAKVEANKIGETHIVAEIKRLQ